MECKLCGWNEVCCDSCHSIIGLTEWIKCNDRLPKNGQDVLVYHQDDDHITVGYFESENVRHYTEKNGTEFYTNDGWETEIPWAQKGKVTHWRPLPNPPNDND